MGTRAAEASKPMHGSQLEGALPARAAVRLSQPYLTRSWPNIGKRQPLAAYRFGGLECMLLGPGEGGLMSMIG
jgi:hypothetical protein